MPNREVRRVDIEQVKDLAGLVDDVRSTGEPRVLRREGEDVAMLSPLGATLAKRPPQGRPFTADDPLWEMIGAGQSAGPTDGARNKHRYLAEAYADRHAPQEE